MKYKFRIASVTLVGLLSLSYSSTKAQLKIGGNPADINPKAILELQSTSKGLLLPRLPDFTNIGATTAAGVPEGMIVYKSGVDAGLYVFTSESGGSWQRMAGVGGLGSFWKFGGNNLGTDQVFGSTDNTTITVKTNDTERFKFTADGKFQFAAGSLPGDGTAEVSVLLLDAAGNIVKRDLNEGAFNEMVSSFTSGAATPITGALKLETNSATTNNSLNLSVDGANKTINLNAPILGGTATYGFLTKADYDKFLANDVIALAAAITADATTSGNGAKLEQDAVTKKWELSLAIADGTHEGLVSKDAQSIGGAKTFLADLATNGKLNVTGKTILGDSLNLVNIPNELPPVGGTAYELLLRDGVGNVKQISIDGDALKGGVATMNTFKGDVLFTTANAGTTVGLDVATTPGTIELQIPDANSTVVDRGLVTKVAQKFAGDKTFENKVTVGAGTASTSTFAVEGSFAAAIRTTTGAGNITATDNTVLAKFSADGQLTLPDPSTCTGRIYTIKKIPSTVLPEDDEYKVTIKPAVGNIEGVASTIISIAYSSITVQSDGTAWYILRRN